MNHKFDTGAGAPDEDVAQMEKTRDTLRLLGEMLEECGYGAAGVADSIQVARVLALSHEVSSLAERLRAAKL